MDDVRTEVTKEKVRRFMMELGRATKTPGRVFFTGGASAVLLGWRESTMDIDLKGDPEPGGFFDAIPKLKELVDVNLEFASPSDFVPALPGWEDRSVFICKEGPVTFLHYDFYGQALSKAERFHERDKLDLQSMISDGLVKPERLLELFRRVEDQLGRYPAISPSKLRHQLSLITEGTI
jgi:hypothetical protein